MSLRRTAAMHFNSGIASTAVHTHREECPTLTAPLTQRERKQSTQTNKAPRELTKHTEVRAIAASHTARVFFNNNTFYNY